MCNTKRCWRGYVFRSFVPQEILIGAISKYQISTTYKPVELNQQVSIYSPGSSLSDFLITMDYEYVIIFPILLGLITFTPISQLLFGLCCDFLAPLARFFTEEENSKDPSHPRRRTRTMQKGYRESTWPAPDIEFETLEKSTWVILPVCSQGW